MEQGVSERQSEILAGLKRRNEQVILWILEDYGNLMKSVIAYKLRGFGREEQEECLNQVLFEIWNGYQKYQSDRGSFPAWIAAICQNRSIDLMRKQWKYRENVSLDETEEYLLPVFDPPEASGSSEELEELLSCLKQADRELVTAYYIEEMSVREIAEEYGMKPAAVYKRIERGIQKCRKQMSPKKNHYVIHQRFN